MAYPTSASWGSYVRQASTRVAVADIYQIGSSVPLVSDLPVNSGEIHCDRTADHRRTAFVVIPSEDMIGLFKSGAFDVRLVEIHIRAGIDYGPFKELIPQGVFRISKLSWNDSDQSLRIDLIDRSLLLKRYFHSYQVSYAGANIRDVIIGAIQAVGLADVEFDDPGWQFNYYLPGSTTFDQSTLDMFKKLLQILGADGGFDQRGTYKVHRVPFVDGGSNPQDAVFTVDASETGVLIEAQRSTTLDNIWNFIAVYGSNDANGKPVYGAALDLDPSSKTYYNGPFGRAQKVIHNSEIKDAATANLVAFMELKNSTGATESLSLELVPNPALDAGDLIVVSFLDGTNELHMINSFTLPLAGGSMRIETRTGQHPDF